MGGQVVDATAERVEILRREIVERHTAVGLRRADGRDEDAGAGREAAEPAHDVAELLEAEVAAEPRLGDDQVRELQGDAILDDRVVRVRDVAERPGVQEDRLVLERLDEVRLDRIAHHDRHRAGHLELLRGHRLAVERRRDHDPGQARAQVMQVRREREDRHDLGGGRDHELVLARDPVGFPSEPDHRPAELAVVDVERPRPRDRLRVDPHRVAVEDRGVERRRQEVVRGRHRVEVAVEVEVDRLHRHDLRIAAAGAAALDAEHRPHRGLAERERHGAAERAQSLRERDRRRGLALAGLRRGDRGGDDELAVGAVAEPFEDRERDLRPEGAERLELLRQDPRRRRDVGDGLQDGFLGDLETGLHGSGALLGRLGRSER